MKRREDKKILELKEKEIQNLREEVQRLTESLSRLEHYRTRMKVKEEISNKKKNSASSDQSEDKDEIIKKKMREIEKLKLILDKRNEQIARIESHNTELIKDNKRITDKMLGDQIYKKKKMDFAMMLAIQSKTIEKLLQEREIHRGKIRELEEIIDELLNVNQADQSCQTSKIKLESNFIIDIAKKKENPLFDYSEIYKADFEIIYPRRKKKITKEFGMLALPVKPVEKEKIDKSVEVDLIPIIEEKSKKNEGEGEEGGFDTHEDDDLYDEYDIDEDEEGRDDSHLDSINENHQKKRIILNPDFEKKTPDDEGKKRATMGNMRGNGLKLDGVLWKGSQKEERYPPGRMSEGMMNFMDKDYTKIFQNKTKKKTLEFEEDDDQEEELNENEEEEGSFLMGDYDREYVSNNEGIGLEEDSEESLNAYETGDGDNAIEDVINNSNHNEDALIFEDFKNVEGTNSANLRIYQETFNEVNFTNMRDGSPREGNYDIPMALKNFEELKNHLNNLKGLDDDPDMIDPDTELAIKNMKRDNAEMSRQLALEKMKMNKLDDDNSYNLDIRGERKYENNDGALDFDGDSEKLYFNYDNEYSAKNKQISKRSKFNSNGSFLQKNSKPESQQNAYNAESMKNLQRDMMPSRNDIAIDNENFNNHPLDFNNLFDPRDKIEDLLTNNREAQGRNRMKLLGNNAHSSSHHTFPNRLKNSSSYRKGFDKGRLVPKVDSNLDKITKISKNAAKKWSKILQGNGSGRKNTRLETTPGDNQYQTRKQLKRGNTFNHTTGFNAHSLQKTPKNAFSNAHAFESISHLEDDSYSNYTSSGIKVKTLYSKKKKKNQRSKRGNQRNQKWARVKPKPRHNKLKARGLNKKAMKQIEKMYYNEYFDKNSPHHPDFYKSLGNRIHLTRETHIIDDLSSQGRSYIGGRIQDDVSLNFN